MKGVQSGNGKGWHPFESGIDSILSKGALHPVAWWKINDGTGTEFADSTGGSNFIGFLSGLGNWNTVAGIPGSAFVFDGDANSSNFPAGQSAGPTNFNGSTPFSVFAWVSATSLSEFLSVVSAMNPSLQGWALQIGSAGVIVYLVENTSTYSEVTGSETLNANTLYHVGFTYNGNGGASGITTYANGTALTPTIVHDNLNGGSIQSNSVPAVGYSSGNAIGEAFTGAIADVRIYNVLLTGTQVSNLYSAGPQ
jgi:hypothetical protein